MFVLTPWVGPVAAVLIESPVILTVSFFIARFVLNRLATDTGTRQRLAIGAIAFVMLMVAELLLANAVGISAMTYMSSFATAAGSIGLAGQVLFALIPLMCFERVTPLASSASDVGMQ